VDVGAIRSKSADRQQQSATLAGLHADYILFILDESGGIPDAVMASAEAALSTCKEGHIPSRKPDALGRPSLSGLHKRRHMWRVFEMTGDPDDPKRSPRVSNEWARQQIEKYGRDNPWVRINVFAEFPQASLNVLLGPDDAEQARRRNYTQADIDHAARILGVNVARFGDDSSVIFPWRG
jgi:phage terminase large subunit